MRGVWTGWALGSALAVGVFGCDGSVTIESSGSGEETTSSSGGSAGTVGSGGVGGTAGDGGTAGSGAVAGSGGNIGTGGYGSVGLIRDDGNDLGLALFQDYVGANCPVVSKAIGECFYFEVSSSCTPINRDAGTVTIETPSATTTLTLGSSTTLSETPLFQPGQTLQIDATGAEVPAFSGSVVAPPALKLLSPSFAAPFMVDPSQGIPVTWPPTSGRVVVILASSFDSGGEVLINLSCDFDGAAGTGTMPAAVLSLFPDPNGQLFVYAITSNTVMAGNWPVNLLAQIKATDAQGNGASVLVTMP